VGWQEERDNVVFIAGLEERPGAMGIKPIQEKKSKFASQRLYTVTMKMVEPFEVQPIIRVSAFTESD